MHANASTPGRHEGAGKPFDEEDVEGENEKWENVCDRVTIGFGCTSDWMKKWRESFRPIIECRKCKTNYFSTLK